MRKKKVQITIYYLVFLILLGLSPSPIVYLLKGQNVDSLTFAKAKVYTSIEEAKSTPFKVIRLRLTDIDSTTLNELPNLVRLQELTLINYRSKHLPESLCGQPFLQMIYIHSEILTELPSNFGKLKQLKGAYLSTPALNHLPESLRYAIRLNTLALRNPLSLKWQPTMLILSQIPPLRTLEITNADFTTLPTEIGNLTQIKELIIFSDKLQALPPEIGSLVGLKRLFISNLEVESAPLPLHSIPIEIQQMKSLEALTLSATPKLNFTQLCDWLQALPTLKNLDFSFNQLTGLPEEILRIKSIEKLTLVGNPMNIFPSQVLGLYRLKMLDLRATEIESQVLGLYRLKMLDLRATEIESTPGEIAALTDLQHLLLPKTFKDLKNLRRYLPTCRIELN